MKRPHERLRVVVEHAEAHRHRGDVLSRKFMRELLEEYEDVRRRLERARQQGEHS